MNAMNSSESNQYLLGLLIKLDRYLVDGDNNKVQCCETKNKFPFGFWNLSCKKVESLLPLKKMLSEASAKWSDSDCPAGVCDVHLGWLRDVSGSILHSSGYQWKTGSWTLLGKGSNVLVKTEVIIKSLVDCTVTLWGLIVQRCNGCCLNWRTIFFPLTCGSTMRVQWPKSQYLQMHSWTTATGT